MTTFQKLSATDIFSSHSTLECHSQAFDELYVWMRGRQNVRDAQAPTRGDVALGNSKRYT